MKRYKLYSTPMNMVESETGNWYRAKDVQALIAERDALKKEAERLKLELEFATWQLDQLHALHR